MQRIPLTVITRIPGNKPTHVLQPYTKPKSTLYSLHHHHHFNLRNYIKPTCCCHALSSLVSSPRWISWIISIYFFVLGPPAYAQENFSFLDRYACEDVQSYYTGVDHLKGEALSRKLNSIISGHHSLSYKEVWDALKILDAADVNRPEASSQIVEIYSARNVPKLLAGKHEGWNREHLWPRSYGLTHGPSLTDLHNIRPSDANVNSSRGNKYFGECKVGSRHCMKPANKEAASDTETDMKIWAPPLQVRGDVARALMYMAIRYGFPQPAEGSPLHLSDSPSMGNLASGSYGKRVSDHHNQRTSC